MNPPTKDERIARLKRNAADLVIDDMKQRAVLGLERYGVPLTPLNGRSSLQDLYEELQDACFYVRNGIEERKIDERWFKCFQLLFGIWQDCERSGTWMISPDYQEKLRQFDVEVALKARKKSANG